MFKEVLSLILKYIKSNRGKSIGIVLGFLVALLVLIIGFFKTFFIAICIVAGYTIGKKIDEGENIKELIIKSIESIKNKDSL